MEIKNLGLYNLTKKMYNRGFQRFFLRDAFCRSAFIVTCLLKPEMQKIKNRMKKHLKRLKTDVYSFYEKNCKI